MIAAAFYAEELGCSDAQARRVVEAMRFLGGQSFACNPTPWAKHDKTPRIYFDAWSQNSFPAVARHYRWYYDAERHDIFASGANGVSPLSAFVRLAQTSGYRGSFSGSRTRQALVGFGEAFYAQKDAWH